MKNCSEKFDDLWAWRHFRPWLGCSMVSLTRTRLFRFDSDMVEEMAETRDIWKCYFCSGTNTNSIPTNKNLQLPKTIKYHIYFGDSSALLTIWTLYLILLGRLYAVPTQQPPTTDPQTLIYLRNFRNRKKYTYLKLKVKCYKW